MDEQARKKELAAKAAVDYVIENEYLGVGTGTTVSFFIAALQQSGKKVKACVSSSEATTRQLLAFGCPVVELNEIEGRIPVYVDGCDEIDANFNMIKGGGAALTGDKIGAQASDKFVCIADDTKLVKQLGTFPLPLEVLPKAVEQIKKSMEGIRGVPKVRECITDYGNNIIDVSGLQIQDPLKLEEAINQLPGLVTCGIFAKRGADVLIFGSSDGVKITTKKNKFSFKK